MPQPMPLTKQEWQQVKSWFNDLLNLDKDLAVGQLNKLTDDTRLKQAVIDMLEIHQQSVDKTLTPQQSAASIINDQSSLKPGQPFGRYQIIEPLGSGGMGQVYLAERDDEVKQQVAIKLLSEHSLNDQAQIRFDTERRILATLQHPNIARLIDAGNWNNRPYYAMEYIDGMPIDTYCQQRQLGLTDRLKLFLKICDAVTHAHNNLIVHRDLKPSNILVTPAAEVKLLDFGIAKPLKILPGTEAVHETLVGTTALTPQYAAPEQIQGDSITVSCDIYVLGLVLYQLLTGQHAFELAHKTWGEIEQIINHELPTLPSSLTRKHQATNIEWSAKLKGDLDAIVAHALKKLPVERYQSVRELADDIQHYLNHEPIQIKRSQRGYRLRKQLRRHWLPLAALSTLFTILSLSSFWIWRQSETILFERDKALTETQVAEEVTDFLIEIFKSADPTQTLGTQLSAGDILNQGVQQMERQTVKPEVKNRLLVALGDVYNNLGEFDQANNLYQKYQPEVLAIDHDHQWLIKQASLNLKINQSDLASELLDDIDLEQTEITTDFEIKRLRTLLSLDAGELQTAEQMAHDALAWTLDNFESGSKQHVNALLTLVATKKKDVSKRQEVLELNLQTKALTQNQPKLKLLNLETTAEIAKIYRKLHQYEEAESMAIDYHREIEHIYGDDSLSYANSLSLLANIYYMQKRYDESLDLRLRSMEILEKFLAADSPKLAIAHFNTAILYSVSLEDHESSLPHYSRAFEILGSSTGQNLINLNYMKIAHSKTLIEMGQYEVAEQQLFDLLDFYRPYKLKAKRNESIINLLLAYLYDQTNQTNQISSHLNWVLTHGQNAFAPDGDYEQIFNALKKKYAKLIEN